MVLLIDTVTAVARIGLYDGTRVVKEEQWESRQHVAEELAARIQRLLAEQRATLADISCIRVHAGPGNFTSLRVGVVTANALAYALRVPLESIVGTIQTLTELSRLAPTASETFPVLPLYRYPPRITPRITPAKYTE